VDKNLIHIVKGYNLKSVNSPLLTPIVSWRQTLLDVGAVLVIFSCSKKARVGKFMGLQPSELGKTLKPQKRH